jgi:hypothetical protein
MAVLFVVPAAIVAPSQHVAAAIAAGLVMIAIGVWVLLLGALVGMLIFGASPDPLRAPTPCRWGTFAECLGRSATSRDCTALPPDARPAAEERAPEVC